MKGITFFTLSILILLISGFKTDNLSEQQVKGTTSSMSSLY